MPGAGVPLYPPKPLFTWPPLQVGQANVTTRRKWNEDCSVRVKPHTSGSRKSVQMLPIDHCLLFFIIATVLVVDGVALFMYLRNRP